MICSVNVKKTKVRTWLLKLQWPLKLQSFGSIETTLSTSSIYFVLFVFVVFIWWLIDHICILILPMIQWLRMTMEWLYANYWMSGNSTVYKWADSAQWYVTLGSLFLQNKFCFKFTQTLANLKDHIFIDPSSMSFLVFLAPGSVLGKSEIRTEQMQRISRYLS